MFPLTLALVLGIVFALVVALVVTDALLPRRTPYRKPSGAGPFAFPAGFRWGAATADHQIEHAQPSDWTAFEQDARANKRQEHDDKGIKRGHIRGVADVPALWLEKKTDFDGRVESDAALTKALGHNAQRLSMSWSRLFPREGMTQADPAGLAFYDRVVDSLLANGIEPFVTLFHFATPQWLWKPVDGQRGVERADAVEHYARFADAVVSRFGDRVSTWTTLNEPVVWTVMGYLDAYWPPFERRPQPKALEAAKCLARMHHAGADVIHAAGRQRHKEMRVGIAQHMRTFVPASNASVLDRFTALGIRRSFMWWFLKRVMSSCDYVGVNYYGRYYVRSSGLGKFELAPNDEKNEPLEQRSDLGWATDNAGLEDVLCDVARRFNKPIYVLENGMADREDDDWKRRQFLVGQTHAVWRALQRGADVRGYFYWTLYDNFEWAEGFHPRFGLVRTDYENDFARTPRKSAALFARLARDNAISAHDFANDGR